jgi:hypothetical protein
VSERDWFSPGQVWRPRRGRHGPRLTVVNVHRADRLVEVIDASETDCVRAKRTLLRFGELRASHRLEETDPPQHRAQARAKRAQTRESDSRRPEPDGAGMGRGGPAPS